MVKFNFHSEFPECLFRPSLASKERYASRVNSGGVIASNSTLFIASLTRNNLRTLKMTLSRLQKLGLYFKDYRILIVENDSTDGTQEFLSNTHFGPNVYRISQNIGSVQHNGGKSVQRIYDMARYRNTYFHSEALAEFNPDFLIVYDSDIEGGFSYEGIFNSLGFEQDWTVVGSNGLLYRTDDFGSKERLMYDTWAYRQYGSWCEMCGEKGNKIRLERGDEPQKVYSVFGGLCLYKYQRIKDYSYYPEDCDHVSLHKQIINANESIYLNPSQIVLYNGHQYCD